MIRYKHDALVRKAFTGGMLMDVSDGIAPPDAVHYVNNMLPFPKGALTTRDGRNRLYANLDEGEDSIGPTVYDSIKDVFRYRASSGDWFNIYVGQTSSATTEIGWIDSSGGPPVSGFTPIETGLTDDARTIAMSSHDRLIMANGNDAVQAYVYEDSYDGPDVVTDVQSAGGNLTNGADYTWVITAVLTDGGETDAGTVSNTETIGAVDKQVTITWADLAPSAFVSSYRLWRKRVDAGNAWDNYYLVDSIAKGVETYLDGEADGTVYNSGDGTSLPDNDHYVRNVGLNNGPDATSAAPSNGGSLTDAETYTWKVTAVYTGDGETNAGTVSTARTAATPNLQVVLTWPVVTPPVGMTLLAYNVWRKKTSATVWDTWYYVAQVAAGTETYTDGESDADVYAAAAGTKIHDNHNAPLSGSDGCVWWEYENRAAYWSPSSNRIYFSDTAKPEQVRTVDDTYDADNVAQYIDVPQDNPANEIIGIIPNGSYLMVFNRRGVSRVFWNQDTSLYIVEGIVNSSDHGLIGKKAIAVSDIGEVYYLSTNGLRVVRGRIDIAAGTSATAGNLDLVDRAGASPVASSMDDIARDIPREYHGDVDVAIYQDMVHIAMARGRTDEPSPTCNNDILIYSPWNGGFVYREDAYVNSFAIVNDSATDYALHTSSSAGGMVFREYVNGENLDDTATGDYDDMTQVSFDWKIEDYSRILADLRTVRLKSFIINGYITDTTTGVLPIGARIAIDGARKFVSKSFNFYTGGGRVWSDSGYAEYAVGSSSVNIWKEVISGSLRLTVDSVTKNLDDITIYSATDPVTKMGWQGYTDVDGDGVFDDTPENVAQQLEDEMQDKWGSPAFLVSWDGSKMRISSATTGATSHVVDMTTSTSDPPIEFAAGADDKAGNSITAHGFTTGDGPLRLETTNALPAGLAVDTDYWVEVIDISTMYFHLTEAGALASDPPVDITSTGTGTHKYYMYEPDVFTARTDDIVLSTTIPSGFMTGDGAFRLETTDTLPAGLAVDTDYWVEELDLNLFTLRAGVVSQDLTDSGAGTHKYSICNNIGIGVITASDLIIVGQNYGWSAGDGPIMFSTTGTLPDPIGENTEYYVNPVEPGEDDIEFYFYIYLTYADAVADTNRIDILDEGGIGDSHYFYWPNYEVFTAGSDDILVADTTQGTLVVDDGPLIMYSTGTLPSATAGGLLEGNWTYYVDTVTNTNTFYFHTSKADALASNTPVDITDTGTGTHKYYKYDPVEFTAAVSDVVSTLTTAHGLSTGDGPYIFTTTDTLPDGLDLATQYWVEKINIAQFYIHLTKAAAIAGSTPVDITDAGAGTHSYSTDLSSALYFNAASKDETFVNSVDAGNEALVWADENSGEETKYRWSYVVDAKSKARDFDFQGMTAVSLKVELYGDYKTTIYGWRTDFKVIPSATEPR